MLLQCSLETCAVRGIFMQTAIQFCVFLGDFLLDKYDGATEVKVNRRGRLSMRDPRFSVPTANDLVYLDDSPNYCLPNSTLGSLGNSITFKDFTYFLYGVFLFRKRNEKILSLSCM